MEFYVLMDQDQRNSKEPMLLCDSHTGIGSYWNLLKMR